MYFHSFGGAIESTHMSDKNNKVDIAKEVHIMPHTPDISLPVTHVRPHQQMAHPRVNIKPANKPIKSLRTPTFIISNLCRGISLKVIP